MCCAIMVVIKDSMVMQTHKQHMYGLVRACMRACVNVAMHVHVHSRVYAYTFG